MAIRQLSLNNFRNLISTTVDLNANLNIITGLNGSGKTSFLEALHIICQGRSFKTHSINHCIQHKKNSFLLFSLFDDYKAGISRNNKTSIIRIDNKTIHKVSLLAKKTPVRIINSSSFDLIIGTPVHKREYIDWCLFHVEHNYQSLWSDHKHSLKQRNALLKTRNNLSELYYWDKKISQLGMSIFNFRKKYIKSLQLVLDQEFPETIQHLNISLVYKPGWNVELSLLENLNSSRNKDIKNGFTQCGIHRDNIDILSYGRHAQTVLSRGEIKKLTIILIISQVYLLQKVNDREIMILIDDIDSELDEGSVKYLLNKLNSKKIQLFITNIESKEYLCQSHEEYKMFHVEHGMIKAVKHK
ncbi:MAG: DNA replication/repair protein RecF [Gammaproteobacteria bacterium]|nr:DNA replication/repair protein RecF [Gammaproteobacteria bacterium]